MTASSPRAAALAGLLVLLVFAGHAALYRAQINDDAFITFRYSKFLTLDRGPYYNEGERVEGYSNPSMMLLMAGALALVGDARVLAAAKTIGLAAGMAALVFTWLLSRAWLGRTGYLAEGTATRAAWLAPLLVAVQAGYALNTTTGLETTLFSASIVLGLWLCQRGEDDDRWRGAGAAFALCAVTRPEGAAVFGAAAAGRLLAGAWREPRKRRRLALDVLVVGAAVAALLSLRWALYDGELLPNTYHAKLGGMGGLEGAAGYLRGFSWKHFAYVAWLPALLPLLARRAVLRRAVLPGLSVLAFGVGAVFVTGPDWMPGYRLLVPYLPVWAALSVAGIFAFPGERRTPRRRRIAGPAIALGLAVALVAWQHPLRARYREDCETRAKGYVEGHAALADWILDRAAPGDTVALMDIGIVGFRGIDLRILDITGLTDRYIAVSPGGFLDKPHAPDYVFERNPEYLVVAFAGPAEIERGESVSLVPWSPIERRLVRHPDFRARYVHPRPVDPRAGLLEQLAAQFGAARVFEHDYPGRSYFLFVHVREGHPPRRREERP